MVKLGNAQVILTARQKITLHGEIASAFFTCVMINIDVHTAIAGMTTLIKELSLQSDQLGLTSVPDLLTLVSAN